MLNPNSEPYMKITTAKVYERAELAKKFFCNERMKDIYRMSGVIHAINIFCHGWDGP